MEEGEEEPTDIADPASPGKWLALEVERTRGWKETVGDTGPRGDVGLETAHADGKTKVETHRTILP
jgi:hypothetical protein